MSPRDLKQKYRLTNAKLAVLLGKDCRTIERYLSLGRFPEAVGIQCLLLDFWLAENQSFPPYVWGIQ
jgi:hypothetical protein